MCSSPPLYQKALIIGATSGIGLSLAARLVSHGTKVIVTGRRQSRLDSFVADHGTDKASAYTFDILNLPNIPTVAREIIDKNPDLDCVVVNAGIQRPFDFTKPDTIDFSALNDEITTNYTSAVHLSMAFLDQLQRTSASGRASLVYISATLGLVPTMLRTANYNASKAALHHFIWAFREQLKRSGSRVDVVEVFPPAVQTELHDERHQPDLKDGGKIGMPLEVFTDGVIEGLERRDEQVAVGPGQAMLDGFEAERQKVWKSQVDVVDGMLQRFMR